MDERDWLAERFQAHRPHLRAVAYRMLGSLTEADDAVQGTWLRLSRGRTGTSEVHNLGGWLTTLVARECLDMLRARRAARGTPGRAPARPGRQPAAQVVDLAGVGAAAAEPQPGSLDGVVGLAERAEHPVGHRPQVGAVGLEPLGQPVVLVHRRYLPPSPSDITVVEANPAEVTPSVGSTP